MLKRTKLLTELKAKIDHLAALLESGEVQQWKKDSDELKKTKELLSHVKFKIKDVRIVEDTNTGKQKVIVVYELPRIELELDENGNPNKNDFFYSSNMLDMISLEDMSYFQKILRNRKRM